MSPRGGRIDHRRLVLLGALCLVLGACTSHVRAVRVDRTVAHRDVARSAVTTGEPSWPTRDALLERDLFDAFDERPEVALADLHRAMVAADGDPDLLFALAELSFLHGRATVKPEHQLAAAVYAYAFLFPEEGGTRPGPFDPRLREALSSAVAQLDPEAKDPALRRMVLVGHSQGGLLVKMQSIHSGDRIWNAVSRKPLDELRLTDSSRELLRRGLFVEPLPEVSRVVFISTPHRGSFLAGRRIIASLARRLTHLPFQLSRLSADIARNRDAAKSPFVPTAVDNMSPRHPFILGLQEIPVAPSIEAHSIISVKGTGPPQQGNDGVVEYASAHIDEVESELVVRSPHSCQGNPHTMEEVRRILRLHVGLATGAGP